MKQVSIYTTPTCQYCKMAKDFFAENSVEITEFDVSVEEEKRNEMVEKSGQMGVPVIVVKGEGEDAAEDIVVGFDEPRLKELLGL